MPRLEFLIHPHGQTQRIELKPLPFRLGREASVHFSVPNGSVSKEHAEIYETAEQFWIRDLGSSNGTFLNGDPVRDSVLSNGDIIHLARCEFRFYDERFCQVDTEVSLPPPTTLESLQGLKKPASALASRPLLQQMIQTQSVRVAYQPIKDLHTRTTFGFEALGRGDSAKLTDRPAELFHLASACALTADLSRAFRRAALEESWFLPLDPDVFC